MNSAKQQWPLFYFGLIRNINTNSDSNPNLAGSTTSRLTRRNSPVCHRPPERVTSFFLGVLTVHPIQYHPCIQYTRIHTFHQNVNWQSLLPKCRHPIREWKITGLASDRRSRNVGVEMRILMMISFLFAEVRPVKSESRKCNIFFAKTKWYHRLYKNMKTSICVLDTRWFFRVGDGRAALTGLHGASQGHQRRSAHGLPQAFHLSSNATNKPKHTAHIFIWIRPMTFYSSIFVLRCRPEFEYGLRYKSKTKLSTQRTKFVDYSNLSGKVSDISAPWGSHLNKHTPHSALPQAGGTVLHPRAAPHCGVGAVATRRPAAVFCPSIEYTQPSSTLCVFFGSSLAH